MSSIDPVNILLVDDQPGKLLSYEAVLEELGETLIKASSGREALEYLLKTDVAVVLIDVCMPELDGFQLAEMIRSHPRFEKTAIIFISAILLTDIDRIRGYAMGAVDYVPVPVVPEVLRAKVRIFAELHRKTRQLEKLNSELERRVSERTAELEAANALLLQSERRRTLALTAGQMGSWDYVVDSGQLTLDESQYHIFGLDPSTSVTSLESIQTLIDSDDRGKLEALATGAAHGEMTHHAEFRIRRPGGELRWCMGSAAGTFDANGQLMRVGGVTIDITERKKTEERQTLLAREVDHRARNALAVIQAIVRLTRADSVAALRQSIDGRIMALARAHSLLSESRWNGADWSVLVREELEPYRINHGGQVVLEGPSISLRPTMAQMLALAVHELATNAAKYGALSRNDGDLTVKWEQRKGGLFLQWTETRAPPRADGPRGGFGLNLITSSIEHQLGGKTNFEWRPDGLACEIYVPLDLDAQAADASAQGSGEPAIAPAKRAVARRVLVVEDEALVAMMLTELLEELGCQVVGPYKTIDSASAAAAKEAIDFAILDVNLGGDLTYPIANRLTARGVGFVFLTGYDAGALDSSFDGMPIVQKPVDQDNLRALLTSQLGKPAGLQRKLAGAHA